MTLSIVNRQKSKGYEMIKTHSYCKNVPIGFRYQFWLIFIFLGARLLIFKRRGLD